ncbi:Protein NRDE2-like [Stylophora pistillata]|uniref:Protein NRDE2-like n=1 Tax=Stylophora pistillata TaxID=50429 RepID=A0A2B4SCT4_STYPI|nr:Protein NRDE2-like [Stylophora pistillata]
MADETKDAVEDGVQGVNQPNWLRNESYKDVIEHQKTSVEQHESADQGGKRAQSDISSSDDEGELHSSKEIKEKSFDVNEKVRKYHKDKKKHRHKKKRKHEKEKSGSKDYINEDASKPNTIWIEEAQLVPEKAFRLHKKPDMANRMYDTLYRLDIALYKLKSNATCLGLGKHQVIELFEKKGKKKKKQDKTVRYWRVKDFQLPENADNISMTLQSTVDMSNQRVNLVDGSNYISLKLPSQEDIGQMENSHISSREALMADRDSQESDILQKIRELNKILHDEPHDIQTWLALVDLQEEVVRREDSVQSSFTATGRERRTAATRTVIEKKIAVLEKALQKNPNTVELIVGHLNLCNEILDTEELVQKWKKISFIHPNNTLLWKNYILFMQSRFSVFSFSKTAVVYGKCLSTLSSIKEGTFASHQAEGDLESEMVDLFISECQFSKQSGHTEKAVACLQAMVELNCFCSPELERNTPVTGQMAFLETFWDSGQPRFGEDGASGWKSWTAQGNRTDSSKFFDVQKIFKESYGNAADENDSLNDDDDFAIDKEQPLWRNWIQVELNRQRKHLHPWLPDKEAGETEDDCDDAERLVLFDDISSSLFKIADTGNKLKLVLTFLKLLGVPVPCMTSSTHINVQQFLNTSLEHKSQLLETGISAISQCLGLQQSCYWDEGIFTNTSDFQWPSTKALIFIRNIFVQSFPVFEGSTKSFLMVLWLWFEFGLTQKELSPKLSKKKYKDVRKLAKSLLKQPESRNDLKLWQAFAEIEWLSGNREEARRLFDSTLMMAGEMFPEEQSRRAALVPLVRSYVELEVGITLNSKEDQSSEGSKKALQILTSFADGARIQPSASDMSTSDLSSVQLLKAHRIYQKLHRNIVETIEPRDSKELLAECSIATGSVAVHLEACIALFEYLSSSIQSLLSMCNEFISMISPGVSSPTSLREMDIELILTFYVKLFRFHSKMGQTLPLKDIRHIALSALERFPDNPKFFSFYIERESKSILTGELRRTLDRATLRAKTPVPWIFALYHEQLRTESMVSVMECTDLPSLAAEKGAAAVTSLPVTGVVHRQYALFERAVSSPSGRHCVALWRMYMEFEAKHQKEKVQSVFYQAIQNCPWAKTLYMDAAQHLPDDLQDIVDLMVEKEIRVRAPPEEIELLMQE